MAHTLGFLTIDSKGRTTLPQDMRRELGLNEHTQLRVDRTDDGGYELIPSVSIPQDQLWYHGHGRARTAASGRGELSEWHVDANGDYGRGTGTSRCLEEAAPAEGQ